jgi:LPS-assembly protein
VSARLDRDVVADTWRKSTVSLIYRDDCSWFELVYQQNDSQLTARNGKPSSSIFFRLNLTTLGTSLSNFNDVR